jgi:class 3 adenylate cyclase
VALVPPPAKKPKRNLTGLSAWGEADVAGNAFVLTDPAQAYMATISGLVWLAAGQLNDDNSAAAYMDTIYTTQNIGPSFVSTIAGPFVNKSCGHKTPLNDHPGGDCQCSKGLTTFHVRRVQDWSSAIAQPTSADGMAAATRAPVHEFDYDGSCGMPYDALYVPPEDTTLRDALIASGVGLFFVIVIAVIVRLAIVRNRRDNTFAPTDGRKPFAMVFTDIQSSTSLWARAPQHMAPAVDLHHELLRGAVKKYRGYEVKTIGDSFMVAFKDLRDAVAFGLAIQSTLFEADWGTTVIDDTYQELITDAEERRQLEEAQKATFDNTPLSAPNNPTSSPSKRPAKPDFERVEDTQGYDDTQWHGLRVRVGIHFGVGDAKLDPITRGYDYYGTTVNTAARVEGVGHGGQVLITQAAYDALTNEGKDLWPLPDDGIAVTDLGKQPLRGLEEPVCLWQLVPSRFAKRKFPPLRLDVEKEVEESDESEPDADVKSDTSKSKASSTKHTVDDLILHLIRHRGESERSVLFRSIRYGKIFLDTMMATSAPKWREATLVHLGDRWRIGQLRKKPGMGKFKRCLDVKDITMTLLASRISMAAETTRTIVESSDTNSMISSTTGPGLHHQGSSKMQSTPGGRGGVVSPRTPSRAPVIGALPRRTRSGSPTVDSRDMKVETPVSPPGPLPPNAVPE